MSRREGEKLGENVMFEHAGNLIWQPGASQNLEIFQGGRQLDTFKCHSPPPPPQPCYRPGKER